MMKSNPLLPLMLSGVVLAAGCAKKAEPAPAPAAEPAAAPAETAAAAPASSTTPSPTAPAGAKVFFVDLKDGAEVTNPLLIKFGVEGIEIAPAGDEKPGTGHHHLILDAELPPPDAPVPATEHYIHFGKGQTETTLTLSPGQHTLQLAFANYLHVPFNPPLTSDKITITVK